MTAKKLAKQLRNIGPVTSKQLLKVGIDSLDTLQKLGAKKAYMKLCTHDDFCGEYHAAYLYALEGAILNCDWREIPEAKKKEYKALTQSLRQKAKKSAKHTLKIE